MQHRALRTLRRNRVRWRKEGDPNTDQDAAAGLLTASTNEAWDAAALCIANDTKASRQSCGIPGPRIAPMAEEQVRNKRGLRETHQPL